MHPAGAGTLLTVGQGVRGLLLRGGGGGGALGFEDMAGWGEGEGMSMQALVSPRFGFGGVLMPKETTMTEPSAKAAL